MADLFGGLDDRLVTRATTEIALQRTLDFGSAGVLRGQPKPVKRHDEARRAEAALRAMTVDHGLLHGMQRAVPGRQMLDGHHMGGVQRADEADAGVDRLILQPTADEPPDQHRAGTTIAFRAAFLGARQPALQTQEVEQRLGRIEAGKGDVFAVQDETNAGHELPFLR